MGYFQLAAPWMLPALGLIAVPIVIHLINLLRHRKVEWAAMEFLLESQRKNSTYILLKQLLLLLMRMAAVAVLVLIFGQLMLKTNLEMLGGSETHHIIILDDSFSMSESGGGKSPFERSKDLIRQLGLMAANQEGVQKMTLWRTSKDAPDLSGNFVNLRFGELLDRKLKPFNTSQLATNCDKTLQEALEISKEKEGDSSIVYVLTDFRKKEWENPESTRKILNDLHESEAKIVFVNCAETTPRPNLAVSGLRPLTKTIAAGVPMFIEASVTNFDPQETAENISLLIAENGSIRPSERIESIGPGETKTQRFQVHFPTAGQQQISVGIEQDAIEADNLRNLVLDLPIAISTLLIDASPEAKDAKFLEAALNPGGSVTTGYAPQIESPSFLSDQDLSKFRTIYLTNVEHLDESAIKALEAYVRKGGGLAVFLNNRANAAYINTSLYREGKGFFPVPLTAATDLIVEQIDPVPDLKLSGEHAIFKEFASERNSLVDLVTVQRYFAIDPTWKNEDAAAVSVIGTLRNNDPFVVESKFGDGRVVTFLSSVGSEWNDWRKNPSFVFMVLELQAYLAAGEGRDQSREVGTPLQITLSQTKYAPQVKLHKPTTEGITEPISLDAQLIKEDENETSDENATSDEKSNEKTTVLGMNSTDEEAAGQQLLVSLTPQETDLAGVYSIDLNTVEGTTETRKFAFNVQAAEGDLKAVSQQELATQLEGIPFIYRKWDKLDWVGPDSNNVPLVEWLLYGLIALLLLEQLFAYFLSYHTTTR